MKQKQMAKKLIAFILCIVFLFGSVAEGGKVFLPSEVKTIEAEAFFGDSSLDEIVLPDGIKEIKDRAYANSSIKKINLPASITLLADNAFENSSLSEVVAEPETKGANWAISHGIKLVSSSWNGATSSGDTVNSAGNTNAENGTDVTSRLGTWFTVQDVTGGWFKFIAPSSGSYTFSVKAPNITESFYIRVYANRTGSISEITKFRFDQHKDVVTYTLQNVAAGETIYWWDAKSANMGYTFKEPFNVLIQPVSMSVTPTANPVDPGRDPEEEEEPTPNPHHSDIILPWREDRGIREVYVEGAILYVEFDEFICADAYNVYFREKETGNTVTIYGTAEECTENQVVKIGTLLESTLQDRKTYLITVAAISDGIIISTESPSYECTMDFESGSENDEEQEKDFIYPSSIKLNKHTLEMEEDDVITLSATLLPTNISNDCNNIEWSTSDSSVVRVSSTGKVTAWGPGSAVITAETVNGIADYCTVYVNKASLLTGFFDQNSVNMPVRTKVPLGFSVSAESGSIAKVQLKNKKTNKIIQTINYNDEHNVTGQFELDSNANKAFAARGTYTVSLVAVATDGTSFTLQTISVVVRRGYPRLVTGVEADYSSSGITVTWTNNEDATEYRILYITEENYSHNQGTGAKLVKVNGDKSSALIPASELVIGTTYLIRVTSYNSESSTYSPDGSFVYVMTADSQTPCVSARFDGDQTIYAPGETIYINIAYENVCKVHYINGDNDYNIHAYEDGVGRTGDIGGDDGYPTNRSGDKQVTLTAQQTPGKYHVQIWAKNINGTHATGSYNTSDGYLELIYWVREDSLDAPRIYAPSANDEEGSIEVSWKTVSGATGYRILYATEDDPRLALSTNSNSSLRGSIDADRPVLRASSTIASTLIKQIARNTVYYIWVQAYNSYGFGELSASQTVRLNETTPTVSASFVNNKTNYNPGDTIEIKIDYSNIIKVHYSNGDCSYNMYSYEGEQNSGDIWADEGLKEKATTNISGSKTVTLPAQSKAGTYHVQIWAKDARHNQASGSYNYPTEQKTCYHLTYTVAGTVPAENPAISLSLNNGNVNTISTGCDKNNVIWFTATYSKTDNLLFEVYQGSTKKTFTTYDMLETNKAISQYPNNGPKKVKYSGSENTEVFSFIPSSTLTTGTYTLRVTASNNNSGSTTKKAELQIKLTSAAAPTLTLCKSRTYISGRNDESEKLSVWYKSNATTVTLQMLDSNGHGVPIRPDWMTEKTDGSPTETDTSSGGLYFRIPQNTPVGLYTMRLVAYNSAGNQTSITYPFSVRATTQNVTLTEDQSFQSKISDIQKAIPNGSYWNFAGNTHDIAINNGYGNKFLVTVSDTACYKNADEKHHCMQHGGIEDDLFYSCGYCDGEAQCAGWVKLLAWIVSGKQLSVNGKAHSESSYLDNLEPGDIIRYKNNNHSIFVTSVSGDTITYSDCNGSSTTVHFDVRWGQTITKQTIKNNGFSYVYKYAEYSKDKSNNCPYSGKKPTSASVAANMKLYTHNNAEYYVVNGFDEKHIIDQMKLGKQNSIKCTVSSDVMLAYIMKKLTWIDGKDVYENAMDYINDDWSSTSYCLWKYSSRIDGSSLWTIQDKVDCTYMETAKGNPVVLRVKGHTVLAIGFAKSAFDAGNNTADNMLIINPWNGVIQNYEEMKAKGTHYLQEGDGWSLFLP